MRLLAGVVFLIAGAFVYFGVMVELALIALILVASGAVIILVVLLGHRTRLGDVALFVIALLVLGGVVSSGLTFQAGSAVTFVVPKLDVGRISQIDLVANSNAGSVGVLFSGNTSLGYQVTFTRSGSLPIFSGALEDTYSLTNRTMGAILLLNASANVRSITVTLGQGFAANVNASTGAGNLQFLDTQNATLGLLYLHTGAGSIDVRDDGRVAIGVDLETGAGSINFKSDYVAPGGPNVPIFLSTGAGSSVLDLKFPSSIAVSLEATTSLGGISQTLSGFTVSKATSTELTASYGNLSSAAYSFKVSVSTGAGSVSVSAETIG